MRSLLLVLSIPVLLTGCSDDGGSSDTSAREDSEVDAPDTTVPRDTGADAPDTSLEDTGADAPDTHVPEDADPDASMGDAGADASMGDVGIDADVGADVGPDVDAGMDAESDAGDATSPLVCGWPTSGYGTAVGDAMQPFRLTACDGTSFAYPHPDLCATRFTVVHIAAGWCLPCTTQSAMFETEINARYADADVQAIQILVQDEDFDAADGLFCDRWVAEHGLSNVELIDPDALTSVYFPAGVLPSTLVVNNATGLIVYREVGTSSLAALQSRLDTLLAE